MNDILGVIPARFASTRLPGKPLADIGGKPMIQWVYEKAASVLEEVVVATDDPRVLDAVQAFGGKSVMTRPDHANGTLRCLEALELWQAQTGKTFAAVVNIQGDEPLMDPGQIAELVQALEGTSFATLVMPVVNPEDLHSNSEVFVVFDQHRRALYFSRAVIPVVRGVDREDWMKHTTFYKHIGLYAYTPEALRRFTQLPASALETTESLEQNRWLEAGETIRVGLTHHDSIPVDTPEDLERVRKLMRKHTP
jgi:3-deoxy-manno-octulosonate cytidylyltransferase (CMP-KDO synthetase)